jgi:hypothetical protein
MAEGGNEQLADLHIAWCNGAKRADLKRSAPRSAAAPPAAAISASTERAHAPTAGAAAAMPRAPSGTAPPAGGSPRVRTADAQPAAAPSVQREPAAAVQPPPVWPAAAGGAAALDRVVGVALAQGARREQLEASLAALPAANARAITNRVLLHAGPAGLTTAGIIEAANRLGLTGETPWPLNKNKKSHISAVRAPCPAPAGTASPCLHMQVPGTRPVLLRG